MRRSSVQFRDQCAERSACDGILVVAACFYCRRRVLASWTTLRGKAELKSRRQRKKEEPSGVFEGKFMPRCAVEKPSSGLFHRIFSTRVIAVTRRFSSPSAVRRAKSPHFGFIFPVSISQAPNKALEPTTMAVTSRAPSSTSRASHGRGSS